MKTECAIALKEWDVVVRALRDGRQTVLLRKGGISDEGGVFSLKEKEFFLYPTWEHQRSGLLNPGAIPFLVRSERERRKDGKLVIDTYASVARVEEVKDASGLTDRLSRTVWSPAYIEQRLAYKPENPLYLVTLNVVPLSEPHLIDEDPSYAGCVSWVPLKEPLKVT